MELTGNLKKTSVDILVKWIIICIPVLMLVYFYFQKGVIISYPDSKNYVRMAEGFYDESCLENPNQEFNTIYAPLFPLLLSILKYIFGDIKMGYMVLGSIVLFLTNVVLFELLKDINNRYTKHLLGVILVFFVQHIHVNIFVLSESVLLPIFYLYIHIQFSEKDKAQKKTIVLLNILIVVCFFIKYSSLIVLFFAGLFDLILMKKKYKILLSIYLLPVLSIIGWFMYCYVITGNLTGDTFAYTRTFSSIVDNVIGILSYYILPFSFGLIILLGSVFSKSYKWVFAIIFYILFIMYFDFSGRLALDERLLIPLYLFLVMIVKEVCLYFKGHRYYFVVNIVLLLAVGYTSIRLFKNYIFWLYEY